MSMSTNVIGFKPADEKWRKMRAAFDACKAAGVPVPDSVSKFFDDKDPDDAGVEVTHAALKKSGALQEWSNDHGSGYEVDLKKLPADVTVLRFYNSW